ncbi:MAG TPA: sigma-54 dependent transcriptional regulator [Vicinamibacteria bacterium]|nr:sigma-54 dependent transcriptional regulator [Vicinamibacteria bacterium]
MTRQKPHVLVCDDESAARRGAMRALGSSSYDFTECESGADCLQALAREAFDLVLLDLRMPEMDGMAALGEIQKLPAPPPVVVVTADAGLKTAIDAVKAGAEDFVAKPYEIDALRHVVKKTLEQSLLKRENWSLENEVRRLRGTGQIVGESDAMARLLDAIDRVAPSRATVLVTGESGTGKELVAQRIHALSVVSRGPFVTVNCAAIPESLVESELFGHRRGAFTGALRDRAGKFQEAHGGTLFLDEIGDMTLDAQAKLLRALQEGEVEPLGGGRSVRVRVRVVAATHRDLKERVEQGRFRDDLLFRLRVIEIPVPPLRERNSDITLLARHFLASFGNGKLELGPDAVASLRAYDWPGNVRELRNAVERASIFCRDGIVRSADLPHEVVGGGAEPVASTAWDPGDDFQTAKQRVVERFERDILTKALQKHRGNVSRAASALGLHRQNLQQKLRHLGIAAGSFRESSD